MLPLTQDAYSQSEAAWSRDIWSHGLRTDHNPLILLIDDDPDQLSVFEVLITKASCSVLTANSVRHAKQILKNDPVDLIVCDVMMPEINGIDFVAWLRKTRPYADIPAIILTSGHSNLEWDALALGADLFCQKREAYKILLSQIHFLLKA